MKSLKDEIAELLTAFQKEFQGVVLADSDTFIDSPDVVSLGKFNLRIPVIHAKYISYLIYLDNKINDLERKYSRDLISKSLLLRHGATNKVQQKRLDELNSFFEEISVDVSQIKLNKNEVDDILKVYDPLLMELEDKINILNNKKVLLTSMLEQLVQYHWKIQNFLQAKKFASGVGGAE